jgi:hypothetical protein
MFGATVVVDLEVAVFHLVWTYAIKALNGQKKAQRACDGLPHLGQARILDKTFGNCVEQTSSRLL